MRSVFLVETDVFNYFSSMPKAKDKTSTVDSSPLEAGVAGAQRLSGSRNVVVVKNRDDSTLYLPYHTS